MKTLLTQKLNDKTATIGIFGLGYVGLPLMLRYSEVGYKVMGFDIDDNKAKTLNNGQSYIRHIPSQQVVEAKKNGMEVTTDFSKANQVDALILCVPTPLDKYREPDLSFVLNTVEMFQPYLREGQVVSLESTTYPGTTEEELLPRIEAAGLCVGENSYLVYSPEREDPGNGSYKTETIPKIVSGHTQNCLAVGVALYENVVNEVVPVSSTKTAEMTKLLENIHRAVNIGLVNELKIVADRMDVDIFEVIRAAATKPFGFTPYYPGPGLGGHCIPIDPFYLTWKAREYDLHTRFIELAGEINVNMPRWVMGKITDALNSRGKPLQGAKALVLGIAYKKNVDDMRESPSVVIMELLEEKGVEVNYSDPYFPHFPKMREHHFDLSSVDFTNESLCTYDLVVIATDHDDFDYINIQKHAQLIIDTRGVYKMKYDNVVKA